MSNDRQIVSTLSPQELAALLNATGMINVLESRMSDGKPVIHAEVKVVNSKTGEQLPGGLPFSVVMFKSSNEQGYSNVAIGAIVPAAELGVRLPRDYFNFSNQRFRFARAFPLDPQSFVIQMDLVLRGATRDYIKFNFGLWCSLFSQMLFELIGRGRESLVSAAEAYAVANVDFASQIAAAIPAVAEVPAEVPMPLMAEAIVPEAPVAEAAVVAAPQAMDVAVPSEVPVEPASEPVSEPANELVAEALVAAPSETPVEDVPAAEVVEEPAPAVEIVDAGSASVEVISIETEPDVVVQSAEYVEAKIGVAEELSTGDAEAKDVASV